MNNRINEQILDAFLEEALGRVQPPDLSDRVIAALCERRRETESKRQDGVLPAARSAPRPIALPKSAAFLAPPIRLPATDSAAMVRDHGPAWSRRVGFAAVLTLAAAILLAVGGHLFWNSEAADRTNIAKQNISKQTSGQKQARKTVRAIATKAAGTSTEPVKQHAGPQKLIEPVAVDSFHRDGDVEAEKPSNDRPSADFVTDAGEPSAVGNKVAGMTKSPATAEFDSSSAGDAVVDRSLENTLSTSASTDAQVIAFINTVLKSRWKEAGVRPSPPATESEWCRRVYLDCIGRIPTVDELEAFLIDNRRDKRARLVDSLLDGERYLESYARFWTTLWTNRLIGRKGGMEPNSPVHREGLEQFLRRSFLANKPYQRLVYELISAEGANRPGERDYNGAVNFLLAQLKEKATPATAKTAQIFLGLQVQCTQCHNHPFNEWKQNRFWELNAFFRQMREEKTMAGNQLQSVRLVDADFAGEGGDASEAEVYFELRNGVLQVAYPKFIDGTAIDRNGLVSVTDRRRELARLVSRSEELKLAIVNRMWSHFFGYGFTKPVDDMGPHNPPSHPELLARLADEFAGHGYDLKRLIRWVALSDAYGLSSRFGSNLGNAADDPTLGNPPQFSHFYVRQMSAEQLYDSLLVATGAHLTQVNYIEQQRAKDRWLEQFAIAFGTDENDEATTFDGTIAQTLVLMNGELTRQATSGDTGNFLSQVSLQPERAAALNELYLAALARRPSRQEVQVANNLLVAQAGNATTALEDIWWALLNSNEFILNH